MSQVSYDAGYDDGYETAKGQRSLLVLLAFTALGFIAGCAFYAVFGVR